MDLLLNKYYAIILSKNTRIPDIAINLDQQVNPLTSFSAYTINKITGTNPRTTGEIIWVWRKNLLRVRFFQVYGNNQQLIPINPDKVKVFFRSTKHILINGNVPQKIRSGIGNFLNDFQLNIQIKIFNNCPLCEINNRITIMQTQKSFESLKGLSICKSCSLAEITQELHIKGINVTPTVKAFINRFLSQTNKIKEILSILDGKQEFGKDTLVSELTGESLPDKPLELFPKLKNYILENIKRRGIESLLPAQYLSLDAGLLSNQDLLIVAETSAGKTLIGEIAALKTIIGLKKRVLYLVPLVALANTKYESFSKAFKEEKFKIGLRVGSERLLALKKRKILAETKNLDEKDILIATYEGIDLILRSGQSLKNIGLVIIDEIQTLGEVEDRGPILDGLITRLRLQKTPLQILGLSATIGNPSFLAKELQMKLVRYKGRPIPLEIHILMVPSEDMKKEKIADIVEKELQLKSSFGFKGQTMVFTNSRRKTKEIRDYLLSQRIHTANYHSGLAYGIRKNVEEAFDSGDLDTVVATYALGAGVDFPASTVIFESLQMGKELLIDRTNIFFQMQGRAGRLGKHDKGKVVLLATPFPPNAVTQINEIDMAMALIKSKNQDVLPEYEKKVIATQLLATMAYLKITEEKVLEDSFNMLVGSTGTFNDVLNFLLKFKLVTKKGSIISITKLGKAGALSFLTIEEMELVLKLIDKRDYIDIAILLDPLENIHISSTIVGLLERSLQTRVRTRFFNSNILDLINKMGEKSDKMEPKALQILISWFQMFFNCKCKDKPDCDCGKVKVNNKLIEYRLLGLSPGRIAKKIDIEYGLYVYPGDLLRWLESVLYKLEGIEKIATALEQNTKEIRRITRAIQIGKPIEDITGQDLERIRTTTVQKDTLSPKGQKIVSKNEQFVIKRTKIKSNTINKEMELPPNIIRALRSHRKKIKSKKIAD
ncbi:MAG: putative ski2-type helicase [Candidatus Heimdallarchaeota archaeon LC_3]|nr:MAG: putative ski2-type helicase [Candidatus Heimdallarchaeota archaeon LC_3]